MRFTKLKDLRDSLGKNQSEMANLIGVDRKTWCLWENKKRIPPMRYHKKLAELNFDLNSFYIGNNDVTDFVKNENQTCRNCESLQREISSLKIALSAQETTISVLKQQGERIQDADKIDDKEDGNTGALG